VASDIERGDFARARAELLDECDDRKRVALGAFELEPSFLAARPIRRIASFRDDAFELELAGVTIDGLSVVHFEVFNIDEFGWRLCQQFLQCAFAFDHRRIAQVVSIEIEQIKSEIDQAIGVPFRELAAQRLKVGQSGIAEDGRLAVDDEIMRRECFDRVRDLVEVIRPIVAAARIDGDPSMMDMHLCAVAVDLDLMQPSRTIRRALPQCRVAWRDESGKWRALCAWNGGDTSAVNRTLQRNGTHADSIGLRPAGFHKKTERWPLGGEGTPQPPV
jgi:hypothetical protein